MKQQLRKQFDRDPNACYCICCHGDGVPTQCISELPVLRRSTGTCSMKWLLKRRLFAIIPRRTRSLLVVVYGRHNIDSMLGIFDWSMKIMLGGVHPLTRHDIQTLDTQRSLLAGAPLGFVVVSSQLGVTGLGDSMLEMQKHI